MCEGIVSELEGIDLGDRRLNQRSQKIIATLAADPQASVNASCSTWAETQAAYRFFDHEQAGTCCGPSLVSASNLRSGQGIG